MSTMKKLFGLFKTKKEENEEELKQQEEENKNE